MSIPFVVATVDWIRQKLDELSAAISAHDVNVGDRIDALEITLLNQLAVNKNTVSAHDTEIKQLLAIAAQERAELETVIGNQSTTMNNILLQLSMKGLGVQEGEHYFTGANHEVTITLPVRVVKERSFPLVSYHGISTSTLGSIASPSIRLLSDTQVKIEINQSGLGSGGCWVKWVVVESK